MKNMTLCFAIGLASYTYSASKPESLKDYLFSSTETFSAYLVQNNKVLMNEHAFGFNQKSKHLCWSISKSVMATLVGMALDEGRLHWNGSVCDYIGELKIKSSPLCAVTVEHLMFWQSGIDWNETYESGIMMSDVIDMLFGRGHTDMASYVYDRTLVRKPGTKFDYSSGDSVLLAYLLRKVYAEYDYKTLVESKLNKKIGLKNLIIQKDKAGTFVGSSYLYASVEDLAQFAKLYLNDGVVNGRRILSSDFIKRVTQPYPNFKYSKSLFGSAGILGGGQWWVNVSQDGKQLPWPHWPADTYAALGHWGQTLIIVPSKKLIFVRTGDNRKKDRFKPDIVGEHLQKMGIL